MGAHRRLLGRSEKVLRGSDFYTDGPEGGQTWLSMVEVEEWEAYRLGQQFICQVLEVKDHDPSRQLRIVQ